MIGGNHNRVSTYLEAMIDALESDSKDHNFQAKLLESFNFYKMVNLIEDHSNPDDCKTLRDYIYNTPGYVIGVYDQRVCLESQGFVSMYLNILKQDFLNPNLRNKKTITLDELKSYKGSIKVSYYDSPETENDLKLISTLINKGIK